MLGCPTQEKDESHMVSGIKIVEEREGSGAVAEKGDIVSVQKDS